MNIIKTESYQNIMSLIGKRIRFISDCELFDNFDVSGLVLSINISENNEYIFNVKTKENKEIRIGSNMKNLQYEIL